jgi:hypothetical protein
VALAVGTPIAVPEHADEGILEAKRVELEHALLALESRAASLLTNP